jgi:hypothetical protein
MDRIIEIKVNGNHLTKDNKVAGAQHEGNATRLRITFDEGWDGFAKTVTFWDALGQNPVKIVLTTNLLEDITVSTRTYLVPIPPEAMAEAGRLSFVIDGYRTDAAGGGIRSRSFEDELVVKSARFEENAAEPADPTPSQAEQIQEQIDSVLGTIQNAAISEKNAKASGESAKASEEASKQSAAAAAKSAEGAASDAKTAKEYSGNPPIIQGGSWWTWDAEAKRYTDTGEPAHSTAVGEAGMWGMELADGNLYVGYLGDKAPPLRLVDGCLVAEFEGTKVNLGRVAPIRGVDYWTEEDKAEIVADALEALPDAEEVEF